MDLLRSHVENLLTDALSNLGITNDAWKPMISHSREKEMGDLSLPCFAFSKQLSMAPQEISAQLAQLISADEIISEVNSTSGYLNFKASPKWLANQILAGNIRTYLGQSQWAFPCWKSEECNSGRYTSQAKSFAW